MEKTMEEKEKPVVFAPPELREKLLTVTPHQFVDYLNSIDADAKCAFCKIGDYAVAPDPTGEKAAIVATPVPHVQGVGVWFYMVSCNNCGFTALFNASFVAKKISGD